MFLSIWSALPIRKIIVITTTRQLVLLPTATFNIFLAKKLKFGESDKSQLGNSSHIWSTVCPLGNYQTPFLIRIKKLFVLFTS